MSAVNITTVNVLDNPAPFTNALQFEIHYECLSDLQHDLEWKIIYVGSAESEDYDQILDNVEVGPVKAGKFKFVLQADAPNHDKIPMDDIVGVTVILLTCSYNEAEFLRVGYYASIEYQDPELRENPPSRPDINKLWRNILSDNPRVTRFHNRFDDPDSEHEGEEDVDAADDDLVVRGGEYEQGADDDGLAAHQDDDEGDDEDGKAA